ncbi:MAG: mannitol dehydrogenase family protein [Acidimicrobiales bacterium]
MHVGVGAFHRAHQAQFTEDAMAATGGDWGISGVTPRSRRVVDQLAPQDGLYTVLTRGSDETAARVSGALREVRFAGAQSEQVTARIADPAVRVLTLTVTEKGYRYDPASGRLLRGDPGIRADLTGEPPRTVVGLLVRGLQARMTADAGPITTLCCDNLTSNGRTVHGLVSEFVDLLPPAQAGPLRTWLAEQVSFPSSMVDRIVPATSPADRAQVERLIGLADEGTVVTEPFRQWVIEDNFPGGRPAWERAGALLTDDVGPYEVMKLRMLNGAHSTLAYLGALAGCETISDAMGVPAFAAVAQRLMREDAEPTLDIPDGFDLDGYESELLERFTNSALRHRTVQVAMDGSHKLPPRLLSTLRAGRTAGAEPRWVALAVAAWMRWVWCDHADDGSPRVLDDPLAPALRRAVGHSDSPAGVVTALLGVPDVFSEDLTEDPVVRELLVDALDMLCTDGALDAARRLTGERAASKEHM